MSFSKELQERAAKRRAEYDSHIRPEIRTLVDRGDVTWDEYNALRTNGYEQELLFAAMTNDALRRVTEYCLSQCQYEKRRPYRPASTYNDAVLGVLLPLILQRFGDANEQS